MHARRYTSNDYLELSSWYVAREQVAQEELLGAVGYIVPGIAAGFMLQTDAKVCVFEPFIANPDATQWERNDALGMIMDCLIEAAKELRYKYAFGFSTSQTMIQRALERGFKQTEVSVTVVKEL